MTNEWIEHLTYINFLQSIEGIGPNKILSLLQKFPSVESISSASLSSITTIDGINLVLGQRIINSLKKFSDLEKITLAELDRLQKIDAKVITYWDTEYPTILREIFYPPLLLYVKGQKSEPDENRIAIVGTRLPSNYGKGLAEYFTTELANKGLVIVSGLARGIDSIVHKSTLKAKGKTIAVIGSGLDVIYPPENKKLFDEIAETGLIISEFQLGTKPDAQNFPRRNRIISGLSLGVLLIETKINGGAMQTAAYAIDQDREVFATPGNINSQHSDGPNSLIQRGEAKLVRNVDDILIELNIKISGKTDKTKQELNIELNLFEEKIWNALSDEPLHIDEISKYCSMSVADCLVNLLMLEFKGLVVQLPGKMFSKHYL